MWTQRDQLQATQFLRRRIVSALQFGDANHPVAPGRRVSLAAVSGPAAALLLMVGFLVHGMLRPGNAVDWRQPGQILIEKESGAVHVLGSDGLVHPVLNFASARLLTGGGRTATIPARKLAEAPRGRPLGIPDAPATLPPAAGLMPGPWTVCAGPGSTLTALIGTPMPARPLGPDQAVVVATKDGVRSLITGGRRFTMGDDAVVALGYDGVRPIAVSAAWLGTLPAGPELRPLAVRGAGDRGPELAGRVTRVGQVLRTEDVSGQARYYVVTAAGLTPITQPEAALIVADPANRGAYPDGVPRPVNVAAADVASSGAVTRPAPAKGYPPVLPSVVPVAAGKPVLCAGGDGTGAFGLWAAAAPPVPAGAQALAVHARTAETADRVYVAAGHGLLAGSPQTPARAGGPGPQALAGGQIGRGAAVTLVTDQGIRFEVDGKDVAALGYGNAPVTPVAPGLLKLLPAGPRLSAEAARQEDK